MKTQPQVTEVKAIFNEDNELAMITAIIDGILHYTADIRHTEPNLANCTAVFSNSTIYNDRFYGGVRSCVEDKIYTIYETEPQRVTVEIYIYVNLNLTNLK